MLEEKVRNKKDVDLKGWIQVPYDNPFPQITATDFAAVSRTPLKSNKKLKKDKVLTSVKKFEEAFTLEIFGHPMDLQGELQ